MIAYRAEVPKVWFWMLLLGILIEVVQDFLPYRDASTFDLIADTFGILLATSLKREVVDRLLAGECQ
jgi:VanZ family protein